MVTFSRAERKKARLRLGICGPSGSGKTYSALQIAFGLGESIAVIDTEHDSASLYAHLGEYDTCSLSPPFRIEDYISAIETAEEAGYGTIILDSITHAWAGSGGLLDRHSVASRRSGNSYTAWAEITPLHQKFVESMLQSKSHIIATMRTKVAYAIDQNDAGKITGIRKLGMQPIQREGMDYEFTIVFDVDDHHVATATKDRTTLFAGRSFTPDQKLGRQILEWLNSGKGDIPVKEKKEEKEAKKPKKQTRDSLPIIDADEEQNKAAGVDLF